MKDKADKQTVDLFEAKRGRGRPVTGHAASSAERQRAYRQRLKALGKKRVNEQPDASSELKSQVLLLLASSLQTLQLDLKILRTDHAPLKKLANKRNEIKALREKIQYYETAIFPGSL